jgi:hypothetical protein
MDQPPADRIVYRWPREQLVRPLGFVVLFLGLLWLGGVVIVAVTASLLVYAVLTAVSLLTLTLAALVLARPPAVLELSVDGYRLHNLRGGGLGSARWSQVSDVKASDPPGGVLVIQGPGQARSVVPLVLLGRRAGEAVQQVRARLDSAHGYRPL